jgi:hypothetical protein
MALEFGTPGILEVLETISDLTILWRFMHPEAFSSVFPGILQNFLPFQQCCKPIASLSAARQLMDRCTVKHELMGYGTCYAHPHSRRVSWPIRASARPTSRRRQDDSSARQPTDEGGDCGQGSKGREGTLARRARTRQYRRLPKQGDGRSPPKEEEG